MADLIERDAVLETFAQMLDTPDYDVIARYYSEADADKAIQAFKDIPAVNRWIPCSERLPEIKKDCESDCVLCYCDTGAYAFSTLQENFFGQVGFACEKEDDYYHSIGKVIAWMPLPEPPVNGGNQE